VFTGIIEETGNIEAIAPGGKSIELSIRMRLCSRDLHVGDSLAVNGCCLTVAKLASRGRDKIARFDLLKETWNRTNFRFSNPGSVVNLERSMAAGDRFGGHFVTGHIDGLGKIIRWERAGKDRVLDIQAPRDVMRYIVFKGSVAVDGISLTVAGVKKECFRIWIIPHTFELTALRERKVGAAVNLETDLIGKYVEKFVKGRKGKR
jgi:riboflavin synthase